MDPSVLYIVVFYITIINQMDIIGSCFACNNRDNCDVFLVDNYSRFQVLCKVDVTVSSLENTNSIFNGLKTQLIYRSLDSINITSDDQLTSGLMISKTEAETIWSKSNDFNFYQMSDTECIFDELYTESMKISVRYDNITSVGEISYNSSCIREETLQQSSNRHERNVSRCIDRISTLNISEIQLKIYLLINCELRKSRFGSAKFVNVCDCNWLANDYGLNWVLEKLHIKYSRQELGRIINSYKFFSKMSAFKVEEIDLHGNIDTYIDNAFIPQIPTLQKLDLSWSDINTIASLAFKGLSNLKCLNLAGNRLNELPQAILNLTKLQTLNISFNFPGKSFYGTGFYFDIYRLIQLDELKILDTSRLKLTIRNSKPFQEFSIKSLKSLNMSGTLIDRFPGIFAQIFPDIEEIILSNNSFTSQSVNLLSDTSWDNLKTLDLSFNPGIQIINLNQIVSKYLQLNHLNLANNSISSPSTFHTKFNGRPMLKLNLSSNNIESWSHEMFNIQPSQNVVLDITNNKIKEVNSAMLSDFQKINIIYLSGNPFDCSKCNLSSFQIWLKDNNSELSSIRCTTPSIFNGQMVTEVNLNRYECKNKISYWLLNAVIPAIATALSIAAIFCLLFYFRWHIQYCFYASQTNFRIAQKNHVELDTIPGHRWDAFVSYCSNNNDWVIQHLIPALENSEPKLHLCIHERDFLIGNSIVDNIIKCIDVSRKSMFLLTNEFIKSQWCQWELQMAQHKLFEDKMDVLVLIVLEDLVDSNIPMLLKKLMSTRTYLKWPTSNNAIEIKLFWTRLKMFIGPCHCTERLFEESGVQRS